MAYEIPENPNYHDNYRRTLAKGQDFEPCMACGRAVNITKPHWRSYFHYGGNTMVTEEEYEELNRNGHGAAQMGTYPIGPECKRQDPNMAPYLVRQEGLF